MKNTSYIGISLVILIFGIIFIPKIVDRVSNNDVVKSDRLNVNKATPRPDEMLYIEQYGEKKKVPEFSFVNQEGDTITNEDYLGKVYVIEFFFTTCPSICPVMNRNLVEIQDEFKGEKDFGIASFTIDPAHDTPEVLKQYAENYGVTNPNWHFLTGDRERVYEMANTGFGIFADEDETVPGGFAHSGLFALVDKEGYIRSRADKFGNPIIYYRGHVERNKSITEGGEEPQINILIEDINNLL
ncbi:SCO family protein [Antarcticibacterium flavum]|uniref:SCO family protein n=1 Tax=Antarcticibacterium flavum TaxID=2058175 RepID=A0A5B7X5W1_9FLAO|nr:MULTISPECIES: SCO family protein [Antarcticibacterium]MCM4158367.1 SCO family protein [Antarcticibacterium sp. W02-3]QCY70128.1 SCO family protein [Antarcticibacterium flavum]